MKKLSVLFLIAVAAIVSACGGGSTQTITGAGATFPLPFYNLAFSTYGQTAPASVSYGGVGSGGGVRSLKDQIVDFAGTDAYLSDKELSEMPGEVIHIPTCLGAVVLAYNLPGVEELILDGELVADIFLGKVAKWNDERIQTLNPSTKLPDMKITTVYRSDGSGTTFVFSDYLTKVSKTWANEMGRSKSLDWKTGIAAKGNPGVAGVIKQSAGTIGYVGSEYGFALDINMAALVNSSGKVVSPSSESISAAASADIPADMRVMITNSPAEIAYPISCLTWIILYKEQDYNNRSEDTAKATIDLLKWILSSDAQKLTTEVHYCPLSNSIVEGALKQLDGVTYKGAKL